MAVDINIEFNNDEFSSYVDGELAVLRLKGNAFKNISQISRHHDMLPWFDAVEDESGLKGVLVINDPGSMNEEAYHNFLNDIADIDDEKGGLKKLNKFEKSQIRALEINMLINFLRRIFRFRKLFITAFSDDVVTPFFGLSLAGDFRFASDKMNFCLAHYNYGIHPSGALPFFLHQYLHRGAVVEMLLKVGKYSAQKLQDMGLVNKIFSADDVESAAIRESHALCGISSSVLNSTKRLLFSFKSEMEAYCQNELEDLYK